MKPILEKDIQAAICDYLASKKYFFWRQNTGAIYSQKDKAYRAMPKHSMKGVADIILIRKGGHAVFIEVKRPKGKQSEDQIDFETLCMLTKAEYYVVTSLDDIIGLGF